MKSKQVLSVEQMKHLQEIGLELRNTSMLLWYKQMLGKIPISDWELSVWRESLFSEDHVYPAYTLQDILDKLPPVIKKYFCLSIRVSEYKKMWHVEYEGAGCLLSYFHLKNLIDAAYETLCWCVENGYIGKENNYE